MRFLARGRSAPPSQHQFEINPKITHWDTGLLFAYDYSKYHHGRLGPVCQGSRDFTINEAFGKVSCNGQQSVVVQPQVHLSQFRIFFQKMASKNLISLGIQISIKNLLKQTLRCWETHSGLINSPTTRFFSVCQNSDQVALNARYAYIFSYGCMHNKL